jgi:sortase A
VTVAQVLGAVGRFMIRAGVVILLFVVYQLWGTGIHTAQAQNDLERQFKAAQQAQQQSGGDPSTATTAEATTTTPGGPGATIAPPAPAAANPAPAPGQPIGQITIPRIGADFYMVEGVELRYLQQGPGHFPGTPLPGQAGNAAVAGHRTTYKAPFNRIDELEPGDPITITTLQGTFTYSVLPQPGENPGDPPQGHRIVSPSAVEILDDKGDNRLTLMACNPKYSAAQRIVVEAQLVGNPAPTSPSATVKRDVNQDDLAGIGLAGGDQSARPAAIGFAALALGIWFLAWYLAHRRLRGWWRVVPYVVLLPLFAVALYAAFENITKLLPGVY